MNQNLDPLILGNLPAIFALGMFMLVAASAAVIGTARFRR